MSDSMEEMKQLKTGTTTVGIICTDGTILGADRKATMGYLVASKDAQKILQVADHLGMTIAGLVGDAQALERYIKAELRLYELQEDRRISVAAASHLIANILYGRRFYPYYVQLLLGGHDGQPGLFSLGADGSVMQEKEFFSTGSGSPTALGVLEHSYRKGMPVAEGKALVAQSVWAATQRDIGSGGSGIDLVVIDHTGFRRLSDSDVQAMIKK